MAGRRRRTVKSYGDAFSRYGLHVLLLVAIAAMSCANQLLLKAGVSQGGPIAVSFEGLMVLIRRIFTTPLILAGYALGALTNLVWLTALSRFEITFAAPVMSSLYFVFLLAASGLFLGESVGPNRWIGTLLIVAGMFVVGQK
jgi:multidrug transporter EmrE-like cation transporter